MKIFIVYIKLTKHILFTMKRLFVCFLSFHLFMLSFFPYYQDFFFLSFVIGFQFLLYKIFYAMNRKKRRNRSYVCVSTVDLKKLGDHIHIRTHSSIHINKRGLFVLYRRVSCTFLYGK